MTRAWRIGHLAGVDVFVDPSWGVIALLLVFSQWTAFSDQAVFPGLSGAMAAVLAVITTLLFFGSVLAHELAHATMSRARGIRVLGITLHLFGGVTHSETAPTTPLDEFLVTVVGPITNLAIGGLLLALHVFGGGVIAKPLRVGMIGFLALENIFLGAFNLLPGIPLDGGRVLRAGVWRLTGDPDRGTRVAARGGQAVAALLALASLLSAERTHNTLFGIWGFILGWFIFQAATATLAQTRRDAVLRSAIVRDVMAAPPPSIDARLPLGVASERYLAGHDGEAFPVLDDGRVIGFVSLRTARGVDPAGPVAAAAVPGDGVLEAQPDEPMTRVFDRMSGRRRETVLVVSDGRLVGVIEPEDVTRYLRRASSRRPAGRTA